MRYLNKHFDYNFFKTHIKSIIEHIDLKQLKDCFEAAMLEKAFDERIGLLLCMNSMRPFNIRRKIHLPDLEDRRQFMHLIDLKSREFNFFSQVTIHYLTLV